MGRHRKSPLENGSIATPSTDGTVSAREDIEERIGLANTICYDCNSNNPPNADSCRKCGGDVRRRASDYRGKGTENSNI